MKKTRLSSVPNWLKSGKRKEGTPTSDALPIALKSIWQADAAAEHGGYTIETRYPTTMPISTGSNLGKPRRYTAAPTAASRVTVAVKGSPAKLPVAALASASPITATTVPVTTGGGGEGGGVTPTARTR